MDKNYKIIKILIIAMLVIICILLVLYFVLSNKNAFIPEEKRVTGTYDGTYDKKAELTESMQKVQVRNSFYAVKNVINKYFDYIQQYHTDFIHMKLEGDVKVTEKEKESIFDILYTLYDQEYINENQITKENLKENLEEYKDVDGIDISKMYFQDINEDITLFVTDVLLLKEHKNLGQKRIVTKIDKMNRTFSIIPDVDEYADISVGDKKSLSDTEIEKTVYNQYTFENIDDTKVIEDFLEKYRDMILYNREEAYNLFDEEYRNKRFGNYETFSKYVDNNLQDIAKLSFTQYLVNNYDGYKEYVCKDKYENLYIFHETAVMDFTLMLDTYTLDNEKFLEKYNSSDDQYKVAMNIDKWIQMLNCRDYSSAFKVLDETFRTDNFANDVDKFEAYMRQYFPDHYELDFGEFSEETGTYIQDITLKDITGQNEEEISKTIYMELGEGTDFVMSFNLSRH